MALTVEITKRSVREIIPKMWELTVNLTVADGADEVLNRSFAVRHKQGYDWRDSLANLQHQMEAAVAQAIRERSLLNAAALDTALATVADNLEAAINSE